MATENRFFANNLRTNWDIFEILWNIFKFDSNDYKKNLGLKNLLPVWSKNSKWPPTTVIVVQNWTGNLLVYNKVVLSYSIKISKSVDKKISFSLIFENKFCSIYSADTPHIQYMWHIFRGISALWRRRNICPCKDSSWNDVCKHIIFILAWVFNSICQKYFKIKCVMYNSIQCFPILMNDFNL